MSVKVVLVNGEHHLHHFARRLLRLLVVLVHGVLDVAVLAINSQRCRYKLHGRNHLIGRNTLQHLDVLVRLFGSLARRRT